MGTSLAPEDPERLGDYWIAARLGSGGQGVVYEAYDRRGARVAVKALHRDAEPVVRERFGKEAEAARKVDPFCTARILDVSVPPVNGAGAPEGAAVAYIVSEYIPGPTLAAHIHRHGPLQTDAVLRLAIGAATALAAIHSAEVIHRDLKPANILLGPDGPRIIDFGIARAPDMSLTATGLMMGTLGYMAPEVLGGKRATAASDVFAWGAVVLFAATGDEPFRGAHIGEVVHRTASVDPDLSTLPPRIRPLIAAALAKEPELRPTAAELLSSLVGSGPSKAADPRRALLEAGARRAAAPEGAPAPVDAVAPLGQRAESAYVALPPEPQLAACAVLLRLIVPGDAGDGSQDSVRTASDAELKEGRPDSERQAIEAAVAGLSDAGALVREEDGSVRPVSAALIPAWRRLAEWVAVDRAGLAAQRSLGRAALSWRESGERPEDLLHGSALESGLGRLATVPFHLRPSPLELRFLSASRLESVRTTRRRRQLLASLAVLTVLALLAGTFAWFQTRESRRKGDEADRRRAQATARSVAQAADNLRGDQPDTALLLSLASWRIAQTPESRSALNSAGTQRETAVIGLPSLRNAAENNEVLLGGGRTMMQYTPGKTTFWDLTKGPKGAAKPYLALGQSVLSDAIHTPLVSQDGRLLLLPGRKESDPYRIVSTRDGKPVTDPQKHRPGYIPEQLSNKGHVLFVSEENEQVRDYRLYAPSGKRLSAWSEEGGVVLAPDGTHYAICAGTAAERPMEVWSVGPGGRAQEFSTANDGPGMACGRAITFSDDGDSVALSNAAGTFVWKTATGNLVGSVGSERLESPALSADGRFLVGVSEEGAAQIWGLNDTASPLFRFAPGRSSLSKDSEVRYDARSKTFVYLTEAPHQIHRLDVATALSDSAPGKDIEGAAVSADGRVAVFREGIGSIRGEGADRTVQRLTDLRTGKKFAAPVTQQLGVGEASQNRVSALSGDGRYLAFTDFRPRGDTPNLSVSVWDTRAHKELYRRPVTKDHKVSGITVSPDGRYLSYLHEPAGVSSSYGGTSEVWDIRAKKLVHTFKKADAYGQFSLDSRRFVTTNGDVLSLRTDTVRRADFGPDGSADLVFSPDGKYLAVVQDTGWVELWDSDVTKRQARMPSSTVRGASHGGSSLLHPAVSPDGRTLAAVVDANSLQLWDLDSRLALGEPLELMGRNVDALAFDSGGVLRTLSGDRSQSLDLSPEHLAATVCEKAGRDITREEWRTYVPDSPYRSLC